MSSLAERMKDYELAESGHRLMPLLPIVARMDGRSFSQFTRGLARPFDPRITRAMLDTTRTLVEETGARVGYTQSDEISLLWHSQSDKSHVFFDRRVQKMVSILASLTSVEFYRHMAASLPDYADRRPLFDCRVWALPTKEEAANVFLWRERDATKNSVSMAARAHYPHEELVGRTRSDMHDMLMAKGINWNDYPASFKRGTFVQRRPVKRRFEAHELDALPPKHHAHTSPELEFERWETHELELPPLGRIDNRVDVLFDGEAPRLLTLDGDDRATAGPENS